jgi:hypothetical protein
MRGTCINTAVNYHLDFFGVASCRTGLRFDTVEVWGSSPHGPTIFSSTYQKAQEDFTCNSSPVNWVVGWANNYIHYIASLCDRQDFRKVISIVPTIVLPRKGPGPGVALDRREDLRQTAPRCKPCSVLGRRPDFCPRRYTTFMTRRIFSFVGLASSRASSHSSI